MTDETYDSFILQIRGRPQRDEHGNVTYPGQWVEIPHIAQKMDCHDHRNAAIIDKGKKENKTSNIFGLSLKVYRFTY